MSAAGLGLLLASSPAFARSTEEVEAPDPRSYAEASPEMLARRACSCRADLKDYAARPTLEFLDRLIVCLEHPDARLRAEVLDRIPDGRLWDRADYATKVRPELIEVSERFRKDPDDEVELHARQLGGFLANGDHWLQWDSPAAQARRRAEPSSLSKIDGASERLGNKVLLVTVVAVLLAGLIARLLGVR